MPLQNPSFKRGHVEVHSTLLTLTLIATREKPRSLIGFMQLSARISPVLQWNAQPISKSTPRLSYVVRYYSVRPPTSSWALHQGSYSKLGLVKLFALSGFLHLTFFKRRFLHLRLKGRLIVQFSCHGSVIFDVNCNKRK
jgi:hypothetical protein